MNDHSRKAPDMPATLTKDVTALFSSYQLGPLRLPNRIVMAPLTRARADQRGVPSPLAGEYYAQRAGAGLIITEATAVSAQGTGYDNWPGLFTDDQQAGWRAVTEAVIGVWGADRVGVRISPLSPTNGMADSDPATTFTQAARELDALSVAYLHVIEPGVNGTLSTRAQVPSPRLASGFYRPVFSRTIIAAGGHTSATGTSRIERDEADLIAYGQLFISNPDLPDRFRRRAALIQPSRSTFYGGGAVGYTDYPALG
jgi:2,4-dienoyl-CoA reductase-like NADH-dependent reductase (Old Yellow Enzyme family)